MTIQKIEAHSPEAQSANLVADNIEKLKALFPELLTETVVNGQTTAVLNIDVLKALVGDATVTDSDEKYGLNWHGKRRARQIALTPSTGTLRPAKDESVDWDTTQNLMIEGDNLEVLKLLQKSYAGKVKLIYIDPPYNTGKDFVYPDNFQDNIKNYLELTGQIEGGAKITSNTDASGRFHTDWLNMMQPRLKLARNLMTADGLIFVSCDDSEVGNLRHLMHEIFGEDNLIAQLIWKKSYGGGAKTKHVIILHEYILCFAKDKSAVDRLELPPDPKVRKYYKFKDSKFDIRGPYRLQPLSTNSNDLRENLRYPIPYKGIEIWPERQWQWEKSRALAALANDELSITEQDGSWTINYKQYLRDEDGIERGAKPFSLLEGPYTQKGTSELTALFGDAKVFPFPKPTDLIQQLIQYATPDKNFIVLDFFAGSGSTGDALLRLNAEDGGKRRLITVQLPEPTGKEDFKTISDITRARLSKVGKEIRESSLTSNVDVGFRCFKLDTSNIRAWKPNANDLKTSLFDNLEHIEPERSNDDVLYEVLLKLGLDLCVPMEAQKIAGKTVHSIGGGALMTCLDAHIGVADAEGLALGMAQWREEQGTATETTAVFRDSAFENDVAKSNLAAILEQHGIKHVRSL
ncbi:site-specific DNA-methyltransferase [Comamonas sp.]|uniref:site-specific DNA-methyltransferase n=1 Tax=Comamonas sp. TaxID=34028 RepID=UPI003A92B87C